MWWWCVRACVEKEKIRERERAVAGSHACVVLPGEPKFLLASVISGPNYRWRTMLPVRQWYLTYRWRTGVRIRQR